MIRARRHHGKTRFAPRQACRFALLALSVVFLLPFAWAVLASLKPLDEAYRFPPSLTDFDPQWSNYHVALSRLPFARFVANTLLLCAATVTGTVLTASLAGYSLARLRWRGRSLCFLAVLATMMLPQQVLLVPHFVLFQWLGWVNTYKPLIVPAWLGGGAFFVFLFRQFFRTIDPALEEAARMDGATRWQVYRHVMLPLARPVVVTVAVLTFLGTWHEFLGPLIYLSNLETYPISLGLRMYQALEGAWVNLLMAASIVAVVPVILLFFVAQRHLISALRVTPSRWRSTDQAL